jgi:hypothetical protein
MVNARAHFRARVMVRIGFGARFRCRGFFSVSVMLALGLGLEFGFIYC